MSKGGEDLRAVEKLINKSTPPLPRDLAGSGPSYKGRSLLMLCAIHDKPAVLAYIGPYFEVNYRTKSKMETALHLAAYYGRVGMCRELVSLGADVTLVNEYNEIPLQAAGHSKKEGARECEVLLREAERMGTKRGREEGGQGGAKKSKV